MSRVTMAARLCIALFAVAWAVPASAANISIYWLDMSPTVFNTSVPNNSVFNVPGVGNVTVTYSIPANFTHARQAGGAYTTNNVVFGPDTYLWSNFEDFSTIFTDGNLGPLQCTITYTFPSLLAPGTVFVGAGGLGATTSFGGGTSTTTVNQNGTFLGDCNAVAGFGATQFTGGAGTFQMQNSVTGAGGADPWWNTKLGVVRIDDAVQFLTINQSQLRGDGIAATVGFLTDQPTSTGTPTWGRLKSLYRR